MAKVTFYGHSCFMVETGGKNILFDPFITPNPKASMVDISTIKPDYILLSHGHGDHIADAVAIAKASKAQVISVFEVVAWIQSQGIENVVPMNIGGTIDLGFAKVSLVNAVHSSSFPDGSYAGNPVGFVVHSKDECYYYAGDTALTMDMKLIDDAFTVDFAFLPIGDHFTMGVPDARRAAQFVGTSKVVGMHFDTFPPIQVDHEKSIQFFKDEAIELHLMNINQTKEI